MQTTISVSAGREQPSAHRSTFGLIRRPFGALPALNTVLLALGLTFNLPPANAAITLNGAVTNQTIEGFGVNVNSRSWSRNELAPVLDAFTDQAGMTLFRVVFDPADWEATNDNSEPDVMNWAYYDSVYASAEFEKLWQMCAYLHERGLSNTTFLNFMGSAPDWMGGPTLAEGAAAEWAEMITSLLVYARDRRGLSFRLLAPDNEPDLLNEGVHMSPGTYTNALHLLVLKLAASGFNDVQIIGPDISFGTDYLPELLADPVIMGRLGHIGAHCYTSDGSTIASLNALLHASAYPERTIWLTEFNVWCGTCDSAIRGTYDWAFCRGTAEYLLTYLANGAAGGLVWEGFDSFYRHGPATWNFWGLFAVDDENAAVKTYTPRKNFYTVAQISKWIRPGARRIQVSGTAAQFSLLQAFHHPSADQITLVGINPGNTAATLNGSLVALPAVPRLELYYTSASTNLASGGTVAVSNRAFTATIPQNCVFTLTGFGGVTVALTSPTNHASFTAPAALELTAAATTGSGDVTQVGFYSGTNLLGEVTNTPYTMTWAGVPMGSYTLTARAMDSAGHLATSAVARVAVVGELAQIQIQPTNASVPANEDRWFTATGTDALGQPLTPPPCFEWSVDGGGSISSNGLFSAAGTAGGPFTILAASGSVTGRATINVTFPAGVIMGNTNEGTLTDTMWDDGAWINASRFQAGHTWAATALRAKVGSITGHYQCAVYADTDSRPGPLLRSSTAITNPTNGWHTFLLVPSLGLTNGHYYWLAVWSDATNARIYHSGSSGTLRWGRYDYGPWPDPLEITGGNALHYCLHAVGTSPAGLTAPFLHPVTIANETATLTWDALAFRVYRLQSLDDLRFTDWLDAGPDRLATSPTARETNALNGQPRRWYRVLLLP